MSTISTATPTVVETIRGPSIAGTRITVYAILDYLTSGLGVDAVKKNFLLTDEQLNAVTEYIELHRTEVERDYAEIVRRSNDRRERYEQVYQSRSSLAPDVPLAERAERMREALVGRRETNPHHDDDQNAARPQS